MFNFRGAPGHLRVQRILSKLSSAGLKAPANFIERFVQAESIFFHHIIFNPSTQRCEFLLDDSHSSCHPDIFKRVLDSLGIANGGAGREIDVDSGVVSLHTAATLKSSFLGVVLAPEIVKGIYEGSVCPRTLRSLTEAHNDNDGFRPNSTPLTAYHASDKTERERTESFDWDAPVDVFNSDDETSSASTGRPTTSRARQEAKKPSPETLERKRNGQAKQRSSTFKSLLSVYAKADGEQLSNTPSKSVAIGGSSQITPSLALTVAVASTSSTSSSSWLLERVSAAPSKMNAPSKRPLAGDDSGASQQPNTRSRPTTTSFQALVENNRVSTENAFVTSTPVRAKPPSSSSATMSDPPPAKKLCTPAASSVAKKSATSKSSSASKAKPKSNGTLFQFFSKQ